MMETQEIKKFDGKEATIVLASGRHYSGNIFNVSKPNKKGISLVEMHDSKGKFVRFNSDVIQAIETKLEVLK